MRKLLLLAALSMLGVLVFASVAVAQSASPSPEPCPLDLDQFPEGTTCAEGGGYDVPGDDGLATSVPPSASVSPTASADASADPCPDPDFPRETPDGCQASDLPDVVLGESATPTATAEADDEGSATATAASDDEESATATASAGAEAEALPETGGVSPALLTVLPALLLVGSGLVAVRLTRRS